MVTKADLIKENERLRGRLQEYEEVPRPEREGQEDEPDEPDEFESLPPLPTPPPPVTGPQKEPKIAEPPEFSGKVSQFATFICHCDLYFHLHPVTFKTDYTKVTFVISRL